MSRARRRPAEPMDTLAGVLPPRHLSAEGWRIISPVQRAEQLFRDAQRNLADAACALNGACIGSYEERESAIRFVKQGLRQQAGILGRASRLLSAEMDAASGEADGPGPTTRPRAAP